MPTLYLTVTHIRDLPQRDTRRMNKELIGKLDKSVTPVCERIRWPKLGREIVPVALVAATVALSGFG